MARKNPKTQELKAFEIEVQLDDAHPNHENHLCHILSLRNMKRAAKLAKDAQYICFLCGRAAKEESNLCQPVKI
jgi:hypothetical protein